VEFIPRNVLPSVSLRATFFWWRGNLTQSVILSHVLSGSEGAAKDLTDCFVPFALLRVLAMTGPRGLLHHGACPELAEGFLAMTSQEFRLSPDPQRSNFLFWTSLKQITNLKYQYQTLGIWKLNFSFVSAGQSD
jgi:hypothetical protein